MRKILSVLLVSVFVACAFLNVAYGVNTSEDKQLMVDNSKIHKFIELNKERILQKDRNYLTSVNMGLENLKNPLGGWAARAPWPSAGSIGLSIGVVNNSLYAIGAGPNDEYNPVTNTWTAKASVPIPEVAAVGVVDNKIYAIGNYNQEYDPTTNTWTAKAPMPTARVQCGIGVVNGKIYVIGGTGGLQVNEEYDPLTNIWATKAPMPTARRLLAVGVMNDKIYAIGGLNLSGNILSVNEEYNPVNDTWTKKAPMPTPRCGPAIGVLNNLIYTIGGGTASIPFSTNEVYDPPTDIWAIKTPMPMDSFLIAIGVVKNTIYTIERDSGNNYEYDTNPPDLTLISIEMQSNVYINTTVRINATIKNIGYATATAKFLNVSFNMDGNPIENQTFRDINISINGYILVSANWLSPKVADNHTLSISVYTDIGGGAPGEYQITEENYTNNSVSFPITVYGSLDLIIISPSFSTISADQTQQFTAAGHDKFGNSVQISPAWYATNGSIDNSGLYYPWQVGIQTIYANQSGVSGSAIITVANGNLSKIVVSPEVPTITADNFQQFTAAGYDKCENILSISPKWAVTNGAIDTDGLFHPDKIGTWTVYANYSGISGYTTVAVTPGQLHYITISPSLSIVYPNGTKQFTTVGSDAHDNTITINPEWAVDTKDCTITDGLLTVNSNAQVGVWTLYANQSGISGSAKVIIAANPGNDINLGVLPNAWIRIQITYMGYTIVVETNSDVLGAAFDKTAKKLDITVSGRSGTNGICNMTIPRPLLNSASDIAIRLDNLPLNFTISQDSNNYYVHIEYHHSTHELSAQFMTGRIIQQDNTGSYPFMIIGSSLFIAGLLVMAVLTVESIFVPIVTGCSLVFATKKKKGDRELRGIILGAIRASPGIHYRRIVKISGAGNGGVSYHLHRLEKEKMIYSNTEGMFRCYYAKKNVIAKKFKPRRVEASISDDKTISTTPAITEKHIA